MDGKINERQSDKNQFNVFSKTLANFVILVCASLTNLIIPASIINIGENAFSDNGIPALYFMGEPPGSGISFGGATLFYLPGTHTPKTGRKPLPVGDDLFRATARWH
jgi:hypothetical protein